MHKTSEDVFIGWGDATAVRTCGTVLNGLISVHYFKIAEKS